MEKAFTLALASAVLIFVSVLPVGVSFSGAAPAVFSPEKQWETPPGLRTPESVLYDPVRNVLYVSSINGRPNEKNGEGFVSKVSLDGKIEVLKWIVGLNAPKGLGMYKGKLYIADIDSLVVADIETGSIEAKYFAPGAKFLNDVAVDSSGNVYVSDSSWKNSAVYRLSGGTISVWLKGEQIRSPNGLLVHGDTLAVGNSGDGRIKLFRIADRSFLRKFEVVSAVDGLVPDGLGGYLFSNWKGKVFHLSALHGIGALVDTPDPKVNAADIAFIPERGLLFVPTFYGNRVVCYHLRRR